MKAIPIWERITWREKDSLDSTTESIRHVFIMAGASPRTDWLRVVYPWTIRVSSSLAATWTRLLQDKAWATGQALHTCLKQAFREVCRWRCSLGQCENGVGQVVGEGSIAINLVHRALVNIRAAIRVIGVRNSGDSERFGRTSRHSRMRREGAIVVMNVLILGASTSWWDGAPGCKPHTSRDHSSHRPNQEAPAA